MIHPRHHRRSNGQTLALFAIMAPGMLALMALGLDAAQVFLERRDAQGAADLAALAGVNHLPDDDTAAKNAAWSNAAANGYPNAHVVPVTPYQSDNAKIEVTIDSSVDTFFMQILNLFTPGDYSTVDVSARAVAEVKPGVDSEGNYVLYALQPCDTTEDFKAIDWSGNDNIIEGSVHSDSGVLISGNTNEIRPQVGETDSEFSVTCVGTSGSPSDLQVSDKYPYNETGVNPKLTDGTSDGGIVPADCTGTEPPGTVCRREVPTPDIPFYDEVNRTLDTAAMAAKCTPGSNFTRSDPSWDINSTLQPGVYCLLNGKMVIKGSTKIPDGATFFAREIEIADSNFALDKPYLDNILMYATTTEAGKGVTYSGNWSTFVGNIYSPLATSQVAFSGEHNTLIGALVGYSVKFNGNFSSLIGRFGSSEGGPPEVALIE